MSHDVQVYGPCLSSSLNEICDRLAGRSYFCAFFFFFVYHSLAYFPKISVVPNVRFPRFRRPPLPACRQFTTSPKSHGCSPRPLSQSTATSSIHSPKPGLIWLSHQSAQICSRSMQSTSSDTVENLTSMTLTTQWQANIPFTSTLRVS